MKVEGLVQGLIKDKLKSLTGVSILLKSHPSVDDIMKDTATGHITLAFAPNKVDKIGVKTVFVRDINQKVQILDQKPIFDSVNLTFDEIFDIQGELKHLSTNIKTELVDIIDKHC